jgi:hypothetical protein
MRFAVTGRDETIDQLAVRVYRFDGEPSEPVLGAVRSALTAANPFLGQRAGVPAGTVVAVPAVEGAEFGPQTGDADATVVSTADRQLYGAVALTQQWLAEQLRAQGDAAQQAIAALSDETVGRLDERSDITPAALRDAATARAEGAKELERYANDAFGEIESDLAELTRAFG